MTVHRLAYDISRCKGINFQSVYRFKQLIDPWSWKNIRSIFRFYFTSLWNAHLQFNFITKWANIYCDDQNLQHWMVRLLSHCISSNALSKSVRLRCVERNLCDNLHNGNRTRTLNENLMAVASFVLTGPESTNENDCTETRRKSYN